MHDEIVIHSYMERVMATEIAHAELTDEVDNIARELHIDVEIAYEIVENALPKTSNVEEDYAEKLEAAYRVWAFGYRMAQAEGIEPSRELIEEAKKGLLGGLTMNDIREVLWNTTNMKQKD